MEKTRVTGGGESVKLKRRTWSLITLAAKKPHYICNIIDKNNLKKPIFNTTAAVRTNLAFYIFFILFLT